jgi:hypothetical protein
MLRGVSVSHDLDLGEFAAQFDDVQALNDLLSATALVNEADNMTLFGHALVQEITSTKRAECCSKRWPFASASTARCIRPLRRRRTSSD